LERNKKVEMSDWPALPPDGIVVGCGGPVLKESKSVKVPYVYTLTVKFATFERKNVLLLSTE
jgi:hypothetical protein